MMGRTHALAGVIGALAAQPLLADYVAPHMGISHAAAMGPGATLLMAIGGAGGAMLPDMDHRHATIAHALGPITKVLCIGVGAISGGHRNGTHSFLGIAAFTALSWGLCGLGGWPAMIWAGFVLAIGSAALHLKFSKKSAAVHTLICLLGCVALWRAGVSGHMDLRMLTGGVMVGAATHVVFPTDILTREGCPLLWPVSKRRFHLASLTTDHLAEHTIVSWSLVGALVATVLWRAGYLGDAVSAVQPLWDAVMPSGPRPGRRR